MSLADQHEAIRSVVLDYLEGMIYGDEARLARAFHPGAIQVGHFGGDYEFMSAADFIAWVKQQTSLAPGAPYVAELVSLDVTGSIAVAKITDTCFGTNFTDILLLVKDRPDEAGQWQIVTKAYHVNGPAD